MKVNPVARVGKSTHCVAACAAIATAPIPKFPACDPCVSSHCGRRRRQLLRRRLLRRRLQVDPFSWVCKAALGIAAGAAIATALVAEFSTRDPWRRSSSCCWRTRRLHMRPVARMGKATLEVGTADTLAAVLVTKLAARNPGRMRKCARTDARASRAKLARGSRRHRLRSVRPGSRGAVDRTSPATSTSPRGFICSGAVVECSKERALPLCNKKCGRPLSLDRCRV